jgi:hypothetical protein
MTMPTELDAVLGSARLPANVTVPAEKLPDPSLRTIVFAVLGETALETAVALCVPVTSPARLPVKLVAVMALTPVRPEPLPEKDEALMLPVNVLELAVS